MTKLPPSTGPATDWRRSHDQDEQAANTFLRDLRKTGRAGRSLRLALDPVPVLRVADGDG